MISEPLIFSTEDSAPGGRAASAAAESTRRLVISSAISSSSTSAMRSRKRGSSMSGRPFTFWVVATAFRLLSARLQLPMPALLVRSWPSRNLA